MLTQKQAKAIGHAWIDKWNDSALSDYSLLYADNAVEVSTIANKLIHVSHGQVKGKKTLMHYWEALRDRLPDHHYTLESINLYKGYVIVHFHITAINAKAIAKIELNKNQKIERIQISHV